MATPGLWNADDLPRLPRDGKAVDGEVIAQAQGVWKRFGREWVLRDVHLAVRRGDRVVVTGPNGAGKTTLLRILAGLARPTRGTMRRRGRVGWLASPPAFHRHLTAEENLLYAARLEGLPVARSRIRKLVEAIGLPPAERVEGFSSGMRKRLALARLAVLSPELWLLDEPETGLDADGRRLLERLIGNEHDGFGVVLATHDVAWAQGLATQVLRLGKPAW